MNIQPMTFDLMRPIGGGKRFVATMKYPRNPLFKFDIKDFYNWICKQRPSLRGTKMACEMYDKGKTILYFNMDDKDIMNYE